MNTLFNRETSRELPFHNQTNYDIEINFQSAKRRIKELMSNNGLLDFIKENNINELCDLPFLDTCQYHDDEEYIRKGFNTENYLNIFSMNIRSLLKHGGELTVFLNILQSDFKVIVLCENWCSKHKYSGKSVPGIWLLLCITSE